MNMVFGLDCSSPDSKVHGANMGPIWGRQDPGGLHVGPMNFAIWVNNYAYCERTNQSWLSFLML